MTSHAFLSHTTYQIVKDVWQLALIVALKERLYAKDNLLWCFFWCKTHQLSAYRDRLRHKHSGHFVLKIWPCYCLYACQHYHNKLCTFDHPPLRQSKQATKLLKNELVCSTNASTIPNPLSPVKLILLPEVIAILSLCATSRHTGLFKASVMLTHRKERVRLLKSVSRTGLFTA